MSHLFAPVREPRISSNAALDVEFTLSMAAEVDGAWGDVDVHQVVDNAALDVVLDTVHQVPLAHVNNLNVGQIPGRKKGL